MTEIFSDTPTVRKFMFDRSFNAMGNDVDPSTGKELAKPIYTQEQFDESKKTAHNAGYEAGLKATQDDLHANHNKIVKQLSKSISELIAYNEDKQKEQKAEMAEIAIAITRKILPDYSAKQGVSEVKEIVERVIGEMSHEPRLVVRVNDSVFDEINKIVTDITQSSSYSSQVVVLADEGVGPTDCRIEWADGGIERNEQNIWSEIDQIAARLKTPHDAPDVTAKAKSEAPTNPSTDVEV